MPRKPLPKKIKAQPAPEPLDEDSIQRKKKIARENAGIAPAAATASASAAAAAQPAAGNRKLRPRSAAAGARETQLALDTDTEAALKAKLAETRKARRKEKKREKRRQAKKASEEGEEDVGEPAVVYLGHIPHGFQEEQMRSYFEQFGKVLHVRLSRSKKTSRSRGYAFIQFADKDVAEIVAETMNNYLMLGRMLKCEVMPADKVHPEMFKNADKPFKPVVWHKVEKERHNRTLTPEEHAKAVKRLIAKDSRKRKALEAAGIDYDFPGYAGAQLPEAKHVRY